MLVAQPLQRTMIRPVSERADGRGSHGDDGYAFPEQRFRPEPAQRELYARRVASGFTEMSQRRVVIAGLARNIAPVLQRTVTRIERLGSHFADYQVVIYENDSTDDTPRRLHEWQQRNSRVSILSEQRDDPINLPVRCLDRAGRMAFYRNQYVRHIVDCHSDCDEVIVLDTDIEGGFSLEGIANTYGQANWDFVGANGLILRRRGWQPNYFLHYDAWAFRRDSLYQAMPTKEVNYLRWQRGEAMVPVGSCFGGLGIYRRDAFLSGSYEGGDCEHVAFHRSLRAAGFGRQFLNPSQIALYGRRRRKFDALVRTLQYITACCGLFPVPEWS